MKRLADVTALVAILGFCSTAAHAAVIACGDVTAVQGGVATVTVSLALEGEEEVAGTQNDLQFDRSAFTISTDDCIINPAIGPNTDADKELSTSILPGDGGAIRNLVVALDNSNPIPSGALYTCAFHVEATAPVGEYTITNANVRASNPGGMVVPTTAGNCTIQVREAPTPTPTPECTNSDDCPDGQVCVDEHCVTVTPTPIGYCTDDEDCPDGEVCVGNMCVTPTPTHRKSSGGSGCSCEIDPAATGGRSGDALALLLPALLLALRWRRRRA